MESNFRVRSRTHKCRKSRKSGEGGLRSRRREGTSASGQGRSEVSGKLSLSSEIKGSAEWDEEEKTGAVFEREIATNCSVRSKF